MSEDGFPVFLLGEPYAKDVPLEPILLVPYLMRLLKIPSSRVGQWTHLIYTSSWMKVQDLIEAMARQGFYCTLKSQFEPDRGVAWWAGFTRHGCSGFNGVPDYYASGPSMPVAVARAVALYLSAWEGVKDG